MSNSTLHKRFSATACSALSFMALFFTVLPAYASDTEVYTQVKPPSGEAAPSMIFMLDTSGSMDYAISSTDSTKRMTALKSAMKTVFLGGIGSDGKPYAPVAGTVKVGLAHYHKNGSTQNTGKIIFPARPLDAFTQLDVNSSDIQTVSQASDDAEQLLSTLSLNNSTLKLAYNGALPQSVGLRFGDVDVPKGAKIIEAKIILTASSSVTTAVAGKPQWSLEAESTGDAATYSLTSPVDARTYYALPPVQYINDPWTQDSQYELDVTSLVQQVSGRSDWCGGNAIGFRIKDVGAVASYRNAYSYDGNAGLAPKLVVYYTFSDGDPNYENSCVTYQSTYGLLAGTDDAQAWNDGSSSSFSSNNTSGLELFSVNSGSRRRVGLRFATADIPQGANIVSATLNVMGRTAGTSLGAVTINGYDQNNVATFSSTLPSAALTSGSSTWSPGTIVSGTTYPIDVTAPVQGVVNRSGFALGSAIGLRMISASGTTATLHSRETNAAATSLSVKVRITDLNKLTTVRKQLNAYIQGMVAEGGTPLGMSMMESASYMLGKGVYESASTALAKNSAGTSYVSPIGTEACVANRLFLLTDGEPSTDTDMLNGAKKVLGASGCNTTSSGLGVSDIEDTANKNTWACMNQMANVLQNETHALNTIKKKIITSTMVVGEDLDVNQLHDLAAVATFGGGKSYKASSPIALLQAIKKELDSLASQAGTISAPGVAVNQFSRLNHLDQLYYAVFESPDSAAAYWPGNIKRYRIGIDAGTGVATLFDKNGADAVDTDSTFFKKTAQSWWSTEVDGDISANGGGASMLPRPASRNMFTYLSGTLNSYGTGPFTLVSVDPTSSAFRTSARPIMGTPDDASTQNLLNWLKGYDVVDMYSGLVSITPAISPIRKQMGGALHSRPDLVNYSYTGDPDLAAECPEGAASGTTSTGVACVNANTQDNVVFFSTMEGVLHAVNTRTGVETFSFVPQETLSRMKTLSDNPALTLPEFGLDLTWTVLRKDANGDAKILPATTGDAVWLFGGMRMGGSNLYALDATNRAAPKLKWVITPSTSTAFSKMGQTWSQPTLATIKVNGTLKTVLIFGGGYDDKHEYSTYVAGADDGTTRGSANDFYGNQVYIVDADTGALIAWASNSGATVNNTALKFSIPSEIKVKDTDKDGLADTLYFGDLGGQLFRIDMDNGNTGASGLIKRVRRMAAIGVTESTSPSNRRRIYEAPSVAVIRNGSNPYVAVAFGSGYRSRPLDGGTQDTFYVLRDNDVLRPNILTIADASLQAEAKQADFAMIDMTSIAGADATTLATKKGWAINLPATGEKSLASPLIFNNEVLFTSYNPGNTAQCAIVAGDTLLYRMSVLDGSVTTDFNNSGSITSADRALTGVVKGLGSEPQLVVLKGGRSAVVVGTKVIGFGNLGSPKLKGTRWYQKFKN